LKGVLSTINFDTQLLQMKARDFPGLGGKDLAGEVTCRGKFQFPNHKFQSASGGSKLQIPKVVVYDFGVKTNILRHLSKYAYVTVVSSTTSADDVLKLKPDGIVLSNGPGDPEGVEHAINNIRKLLGKKPIFGICMGHQLISLAIGGKTYKLKFGHHGGNHPVKDLATGEIQITTQNHCYAVDEKSLGDEIKVTHRNLNDGTVEGIEHKTLPLFSVQYHPEASPGPREGQVFFEKFRKMMERQ
jgi:carbamoyl-phosphate synthase small subunit